MLNPVAVYMLGLLRKRLHAVHRKGVSVTPLRLGVLGVPTVQLGELVEDSGASVGVEARQCGYLQASLVGLQ